MVKMHLITIGILATCSLVTPVSARVMPTSVSRVSPRTLHTLIYAEDRQRSQQRKEQNDGLLSVYDNPTYSLHMRYATTWERRDLNQTEDTLSLLVMFLSPSTSGSLVRENINLVVEDLSKNPLTLNEYTQMGLEKEKAFFTTFSLDRLEQTVLAGFSATRVTFDASLATTSLKYEQVWLLKENKAYVWTFADSASKFDQHVPLFEHMLDTLTIGN